MKNLQLSLKTKWFEMTKSGEKTEDYREITPYFCNRFLNKKIGYNFENFLKHLQNERFKNAINLISIKEFETNTMTLGYPKSTDTDRILILEHKGIEIRTGNPEWGAEPNKLYFVIKHGKPL